MFRKRYEVHAVDKKTGDIIVQPLTYWTFQGAHNVMDKLNLARVSLREDYRNSFRWRIWDRHAERYIV